MLARVGRLEVADAPALSPFERDYGSLEAFAASVRAEVAAGRLDRLDLLGVNSGGGVLAAIVRWHTDRVWDLWR